MQDQHDTISAIATAPGMGAIGVIRVSGPRAIALVNGLFRGKDLTQQPGHTLHYGKLHSTAGQLLDEVVVSLFRAPKSYTRQDVVEISCHGSPHILNRVQAELLAAGARPADPGEFTLRAYMNGALDLAQAEAVADLIASRSEKSRELALQQLRGGVSQRLAELREQLLHFAALLELELDFSEEDVEFADRSQLATTLQHARTEVDRLLSTYQSGNALKNGIPVVIAGRPNAGKSTLLNNLLADERAIVSAIAGTTRDIIEDRLLLQGYEFRLIDTAGLRQALDPIEAEGVRRSHQQLHRAALVLFLFDPAETSYPTAQADVAALQLPPNAHVHYLATKADLHPRPANLPRAVPHLATPTPNAAEQVRQRLLHFAQQLDQHDVTLTHQRHYSALHSAADALAQVADGLATPLPTDLLSIDLRQALHALGTITGEVTTDEILGAIFSKFCIGK